MNSAMYWHTEKAVIEAHPTNPSGFVLSDITSLVVFADSSDSYEIWVSNKGGTVNPDDYYRLVVDGVEASVQFIGKQAIPLPSEIHAVNAIWLKGPEAEIDATVVGRV